MPYRNILAPTDGSARSQWAIARAARSADCDLIVMATHDRRGLAALRSQTMKTVAHSPVPVLVCR